MQPCADSSSARVSEESAASLQILWGEQSGVVPIPAVRAAVNWASPVMLGENLFCPHGVALSVRNARWNIQGVLRFGPLKPLHIPIMGPFELVPFMECSHRIASMKHRVDGILLVNGKCVRFENAEGYIGGDKGRSFPGNIAWSQCFFPEGSLMLAAARVPAGPYVSGVIVHCCKFGQGIPFCKLSGGEAGQCPGWPSGDSSGMPCPYSGTAGPGRPAAECAGLRENDAYDPAKIFAATFVTSCGKMDLFCGNWKPTGPPSSWNIPVNVSEKSLKKHMKNFFVYLLTFQNAADIIIEQSRDGVHNVGV